MTKIHSWVSHLVKCLRYSLGVAAAGLLSSLCNEMLYDRAARKLHFNQTISETELFHQILIPAEKGHSHPTWEFSSSHFVQTVKIQKAFIIFISFTVFQGSSSAKWLHMWITNMPNILLVRPIQEWLISFYLCNGITQNDNSDLLSITLLVSYGNQCATFLPSIECIFKDSEIVLNN